MSVHRWAWLVLVAVVSVPGCRSGTPEAREARKQRRANFDAFQASPPTHAKTAVERAAKAVSAPGAAVLVEPRLGIPTFLWLDRAAPAVKAAASPLRSAPRAEAAADIARASLAATAPLYHLGPADLDDVEVTDVHDTGRGGVIVRLRQRLAGIEVFRERVSVLLGRDLAPAAISGYVSGASAKRRPRFALPAEQGIAAALADAGVPSASDVAVMPEGPSGGGWNAYVVSPTALADRSFAAAEGVRAKPVWYHLPDGHIPAWEIEARIDKIDGTETWNVWVVSAVDGSILFRKDLAEEVAANPTTYRVWADPDDPLHPPADGPQGTTSSPHPTGLQDKTPVIFVAPSLVTVSSVAGVTDPWLPPGATETIGNNVDAFANLGYPDGFTPGADVRANLTASGTFDRSYDVTQPPDASIDQRKAAVTQLFYNVNFLHDWFYAAGFDEAAGNAQASNYGRGGVEGDSILAQAQDYDGHDNADMWTPPDGSRPRMRMFLWTGPENARLVVMAPAGIAGENGDVGLAYNFGPREFDTGVVPIVAAADDGLGGDPLDACSTLAPPPREAAGFYAGKIVFANRGSCGFSVKAQNVFDAGAAGIAIGNVDPGQAVDEMTATAEFWPAIPSLLIGYEPAQRLRATFEAGTEVTGAMIRPATFDRDGSIDNLVVAHEWGHYISNRLVGDATGLSANMARGLGEGWADFHALLLEVRQGDALVPSNVGWNGVYTSASYASAAFSLPVDALYFGLRRYPYSTDLSKNPLTFRQIGDENPLPGGVPRNLLFAAPNVNSEVHNTGEVWAVMLWECYAALLRDTLGPAPRLGFDQARDRMRDYLVAAYKLTPLEPTLLEARDALIAVAQENDPIDAQLFWAAFAKRGAGVLAVAPDRYSPNNSGVVESYAVGAALRPVAVRFVNEVPVCLPDGALDNGESGALAFTLRNMGSVDSAPVQVSVTSSVTGVVLGNGGVLAVPAVSPFGTATVAVPVSASGLAGVTGVTLDVSVPDGGGGAPAVHTFGLLANYDAQPFGSAIDYAESPITRWSSHISPNAIGFERVEAGPADHRYLGPDSGVPTDVALVSPPLEVEVGAALVVSFRHAFSFEAGYDGGVVEISDDLGATWTDAGPAQVAGAPYNGLLDDPTGNPLFARTVWTGTSDGYPALATATFDFGMAYAEGNTVLFRFRIGTDLGTGGAGWLVDDIGFSGIANIPFDRVVAQPSVCNTPPIAVAGVPFSDVEFGPPPDYAPVVVTLDGSGSLDPDGDPLAYRWNQIEGPPVMLSGATTVRPTFAAPDVPTAIRVAWLGFDLTVSDGIQNSAPARVRVMITDINRPPVADSGPPQVVGEFGPSSDYAPTLVTLDGSASFDPDPDDSLSIGWTQSSGPAVTLSGKTTLRPTFTAPSVNASTVLGFQIVLIDKGGHLVIGAPTTVRVDPVNRPPVAVPGAPFAIPDRTVGQLDGSGSNDPDGDPVSCAWAQISGPAVVLTDPAAKRPFFTAPDVTETTVLVFSLVVTDSGDLSSPSHTVEVTIEDQGPTTPPQSGGGGGCNSAGGLGGSGLLLLGVLGSALLPRRRPQATRNSGDTHFGLNV